jgi:hypothetical protein
VTPFDSRKKNLRFEGTCRVHLQSNKTEYSQLSARMCLTTDGEERPLATAPPQSCQAVAVKLLLGRCFVECGLISRPIEDYKFDFVPLQPIRHVISVLDAETCHMLLMPYIIQLDINDNLYFRVPPCLSVSMAFPNEHFCTNTLPNMICHIRTCLRDIIIQ